MTWVPSRFEEYLEQNILAGLGTFLLFFQMENDRGGYTLVNLDSFNYLVNP